jgi:hypothetical protein
MYYDVKSGYGRKYLFTHIIRNLYGYNCLTYCNYYCISILLACNIALKSSGARESHPRALRELDVTVSRHPAPIVQP